MQKEGKKERNIKENQRKENPIFLSSHLKNNKEKEEASKNGNEKDKIKIKRKEAKILKRVQSRP